MLGMNGMSATDFKRYIVRWVIDHVKNESGTAQIQVLGYCVYDTKDCKTLFEHKDKQVCEKVLAMMLNDETKGNKC
jgi:poly(3-hydroxyalkanoate) synthetase